jgi:1-deoxy-D-xylulose-5-phosphate synthase
MSPKGSASVENYSHRLGEILIRESARDDRVCAITAAMSEGTGIESFHAARPDRFFDVGIAEEHALTFAAGLAADGYKPVTAIYSSFMQRGYDQIIHDIALQKLPVLMCIDRAGLNAGDGPTHHGIFDVSFLSAIPNLTVYAPVTFAGLAVSVRKALADGTPVAIRYPNGGEDELLKTTFYKNGGPTDIGVRESDPENHATPAAVIITHGRITREALTAREALASQGIPVGILLCEYLKPYGKLADEIASRIPAGVPLLFAEEELRAGGFGMMLTDAMRRNGSLEGHPYTILATDDSFVSQDKPEPILRTAGVDAEAMTAAIKGLLGR